MTISEIVTSMACLTKRLLPGRRPNGRIGLSSPDNYCQSLLVRRLYLFRKRGLGL
jgi:hypothetical protein